MLVATCAVLVVAIGSPVVVAKKKPASPYSMTGCLQMGANQGFQLTGVEGGGPDLIEIVRAAKGIDLAAHVGQRLEITGTTVSAKKAAKGEGVRKKDAKDRRRRLRMRVQSVRMLAATCS
jgi:hypothetical protein